MQPHAPLLPLLLLAWSACTGVAADVSSSVTSSSHIPEKPASRAAGDVPKSAFKATPMSDDAAARAAGHAKNDLLDDGPYAGDWPGSIAVCAMMKGEALNDVKEWLSYHRYAGVDRFYLRENDEDGANPAIEALLEPYVDAGIVDFEYYPGTKHPAQTNWYNACARLAEAEFSWVAFIDLDEFMMVLHEQEAVTEPDALKAVLRRSFRFAGSVSMQWVLFGAAGHKEPPARGALAGFDRCTGVLSKQMKCLGNSYYFHETRTFRPAHVHQCTFRTHVAAQLGDSQPMPVLQYRVTPEGSEPFGYSYSAHLDEEEQLPLHEELTDDHQIVLFHYVTRSQNAFVERKIRMRSGQFATRFMEQGTGQELSPEALDRQYAAFEHEHGFDGTFPICEQGGTVAEAIEAARAGGWSEFM